MDVPKFLICPGCDEKYNDAKKRRIIDSCGHPRCFSCLFGDKPCPICEKLLSGRPRSFLGSRDSLLSTDDEQGNNQLFTKEQYLRTLYSYDPGSKENLSRQPDIRRRSLDSHTLRRQRLLNLGRYSNSALALPTVSPKHHPSLNASIDNYYENANEKRNSLPLTFKGVAEERHPFLQRPPSSKSSGTSGEEQHSPNLSSSPTMTDIFDEVIENDKMPDHESISWKTSRRSSGYWSERESINEQELAKTNSSLDETRKNKKSKKELCLIDVVLCGKSSAWENTKALFRPLSPVVGKAKDLDKNGKEPDWHFRKFLDRRSGHVIQKDVKVTDL